MKNIISVSRRTDVPAFYSDWFRARLYAGYASYRNPFNNVSYRVSLCKDDVAFFVFWSRNYAPFIKGVQELTEQEIRFYLHYTILDYPRILDPKAPPVGQAVQTLRRLNRLLDARQIVWRYDPIVISEATPVLFHVDGFARLSEMIGPYVGRIVTSFVDLGYRKVGRRLAGLSAEKGLTVREATKDEKHEVVSKMVGNAARFGLPVELCCEDDLLSVEGVAKTACVSGGIIKEVYGTEFNYSRNATREECSCWDSRDVGAYDTCPYGCVYCYANRDFERSIANYTKHRHRTNSESLSPDGKPISPHNCRPE